MVPNDGQRRTNLSDVRDKQGNGQDETSENAGKADNNEGEASPEGIFWCWCNLALGLHLVHGVSLTQDAHELALLRAASP